VDEHDDRTVAGVVVGEVDGIHGADVNGAGRRVTPGAG
jgi:hypothetical protein